MTDEILTFATAAMDAAMSQGADAADVLAVAGSGTEIEVRQGALEKQERDEGQTISLRVFVGSSSAMTSGSVVTRDGLKRLAENAVAMARLSLPDPYAGIAPAAMLAQHVPNLDLASDEELPVATLQAMAQQAEEAALSVAGVTKSGGASASTSQRRIALVTSNGFARGYARSSISLSVSAIAGEGTAMERDYDYSAAIYKADLRDARSIGEWAALRAVKRLHPRKLSSRSAAVIFDRRVASSLLGVFSSAINGAAVARGTSFLKGDLGRAIFGDHITIWDDPLRQRGLASRPFDGEGLPTNRRALIEKGVLTGWLLDLRSSRQLAMQPMGNGARGLGSPPSPATSNLHMGAGSVSPALMMKDIGSGLLVTEMMGSSINMLTGDYSRGASGFWIENGELAYPVSEITIAGNLREMFSRLIAADDLEFTASVNAPSCLVEGMTIAGR